MSAYVMSDIHGCYDELMKMLEKIQFSSDDTLIIAGDYMDRGSQSLEMLDWILDTPDNVILIKGNHDVGFVEYVRFLDALKKQVDYKIDDDSVEDTQRLYRDTRHIADSSWSTFDYYGTLRELIIEKGVSLTRLKKWSSVLRELPYIYETNINENHFVIVHAGYIEPERLCGNYSSVEYFYLCARDGAYMEGGKKDSTVIAGHTPTISHQYMMYTGGKIYKHYNKYINCRFYDIDCGCVYREVFGEGNLACLRLEDEKEFYLYED